MKNFIAYLMVVCIALFSFNCSTSKTTVTDPITGAVTVTDSYNLNTAQLTELFEVGSGAWNLINTAQTNTTPVTPSPTMLDYVNDGVAAITTIMNALKAPIVYTQSDVQTKAMKIALAGFKESGKFPPVLDVAKYVAAGTFPSEKALIQFKSTGKLVE